MEARGHKGVGACGFLEAGAYELGAASRLGDMGARRPGGQRAWALGVKRACGLEGLWARGLLKAYCVGLYWAFLDIPRAHRRFSWAFRSYPGLPEAVLGLPGRHEVFYG